MPHSYTDFRERVVSFLVARLPNPNCRVIDVGAGDGSFGCLIRSRFPNTDAVEIWEPYVERFNLRAKYRHVFVMPAQALRESDVRESAILMGDMLEHLHVPDAQSLVRNLIAFGARLVVVVVPWLYVQGAEHPDVVLYGNPHEVHHQPDLTHELFLERYPEFTLLVRNGRCGVYFWCGSELTLPGGEERTVARAFALKRIDA